MGEFKIKFWCEVEGCYVKNSHDYAVDENGDVIRIDWPWASFDLIPHFYLDGKRIA